MRVAIGGAAGRMGRHLFAAALADGDVTIAGALERVGHGLVGRDVGELLGVREPTGVVVTSDPAAAFAGVDAVIDFSAPAGTEARAAAAADAGAALVVGTTGLGDAQQGALRRAAERIPVVVAPNMSVGVNVALALLREAARLLGPAYHFEIFEMHHEGKVDAPSGTALRMADVVARERGTKLADVARHGRSGAVGPRPRDEIGIHAARGGDVVGDHLAIFAGPGERLEIVHRASSRDTFARGAVRAARWALGHAPGLYDMSDVLGGDGA